MSDLSHPNRSELQARRNRPCWLVKRRVNGADVWSKTYDSKPKREPSMGEEVQRWRPLGRAFDPRVAVIKDTPGPIEIAEFGSEATV
jgi:hypothetical protein